MWPFSTAQDRQSEAMANILAENAYDRKLERATWTLKAILSFVTGVILTFSILLVLDQFADINPESVWNWLRGR